MTRDRAALGRGLVGLFAAMLAMTALVACGGRQQSAASAGGGTGCEITADRRIAVATGNTGGVYYVLGGAFAEAVSAATGGKLKATAAETGASVQNIQQLVAGNYQVAFSLADTAADAVQGKGSFAGAPQPIAALSRLYPNYTQVVVRADAGIAALADLRGSRPRRRRGCSRCGVARSSSTTRWCGRRSTTAAGRPSGAKPTARSPRRSRSAARSVPGTSPPRRRCPTPGSRRH